MLLSLRFFLLSSLLLVAACGLETDPDPEPAPRPAQTPSTSTPPPAPSAPSTSSASSTTSSTAALGGSSSTPSPSPGEPGQCVPDAACGGLEQCVDHCYGERCCLLGCSCKESTGRLVCSLTCS
jgi:hypothetical protein